MTASVQFGLDTFGDVTANANGEPLPHSPGYVADTDEAAREQLWPDYRRMRDRIGAERGWPAMTRAEFNCEADHGSLYVGAPETVARRTAATVTALARSASI